MTEALLYRNQSIDLFCKSVAGFYMLGTSIMKELIALFLIVRGSSYNICFHVMSIIGVT